MNPEDRMWFGTRGYMRWVPCPERDSDLQNVGWGSSMQYLNGSAGVLASSGSHGDYTLSWNAISRAQGRDITDYAAGIYDSVPGKNLIYFHLPNVMDVNVLPPVWASPAQAAADGFTLVPGQKGSVTLGDGSNGYPPRSVTYTATSSSRTIWIPIPPGYTAHVGAHGTALGGGVTVTQTAGNTDLATSTLAMLPTTGNRFNATFSSASCDGIRLALVNTGNSAHSVTLTGLIVQILPTGTTPEQGGFLSGQGHSGCEFDEKPQVSPRYIDLVAVSAHLIETGSWL